MMRSMSICHNIQHKQGNGQTAWLSCFADASEEHGLLPARHHRRASETLDLVMSPVGWPLCTIAFQIVLTGQPECPPRGGQSPSRQNAS